MVDIPEAYLLTVAGLVFIPVFIFCIKMIIEVSANRGKQKEFDAHIEESKEWKREITELEKYKNISDLRLTNMEKDIQDLCGKVYSHNYDSSPIRRRGMKESGGGNDKDDRQR